MNFLEMFTNQVSATLQSINYKTQDGSAQKIDCHDTISSVCVDPDKIRFVITRNILLDAFNGYTLEISVEVVRFAKNDINLTDSIKDASLTEITKELSEPVISYISMLVSQITSSFNRQPIVTPPAVMLEKN